MAYEDDYDRLKPKQPKPERVTGKFPTERFVGKILTSSPVANTYVRVQPVELFGTEEEGQSVSPTAKNREVVAALFDDAVKGAYVIVGRVRHRYVIEGVIGVDWNEGGGSMLERCRCQDTPYEIEKECGSCGPRYEYDPCEEVVTELPRIMPRILRVRVNTIAQAEGEDCADCTTHKGDVIELENVPDEYGDPTCTWAGVGPHCQTVQLAIGEDDAVISYLGEDGSCIEALLSVPVADFNCCGTTTGWEGTEGDTCTLEIVVEPHPCTCCPAEAEVIGLCDDQECDVLPETAYVTMPAAYWGNPSEGCVVGSACQEVTGGGTPGAGYVAGGGSAIPVGGAMAYRTFIMSCNSGLTPPRWTLTSNLWLRNITPDGQAPCEDPCEVGVSYLQIVAHECVTGAVAEPPFEDIEPIYFSCSPFKAVFIVPACNFKIQCRQSGTGVLLEETVYSYPQQTVTFSEEPC